VQSAYGPADVTATPSSLASVKSRMVYLSDGGLYRFSWKKAVKRNYYPVLPSETCCD